MKKRLNKNSITKLNITKLTITFIYMAFLIILLFPIIIMVNTSLKTYSDVISWPPTFFKGNLQWINYYNITFGDKSILMALKNSFIVSASSSLISVVLSILAAYSCSRYKIKIQKYFLLIIISTQMFSPVLLVNPMYIIFRNTGILDTLLSLVIANVATSVPMSVWLLYSYIEVIPIELEESAWIDGCSRLQGIFHIVAPIIIPSIITTGLFSFISSWGDLIFSRSFIVSSNLRTVSMVLTDFQSLYKTTWETQMAASALSTIPTVIIFIIIQKYLIKGMISSGVKG